MSFITDQFEMDEEKYQQGEPPLPTELESGVIVSPDTLRENRLPPGQTRTRKWPVLHATDVPQVPLDRWTLEIDGLVERPLSLNWDAFQALPQVKVFSDFHCVTTWSRLGNLWEGVAIRGLLERAGVQPEARFAIITGYDYGWTTNVPLVELLEEDVLLADKHDGKPLSADHGGPVRVIVPRLYAWKSAKWVRRITLAAHDQPGYWEQRGYHSHGDPWTEQRFDT